MDYKLWTNGAYLIEAYLDNYDLYGKIVKSKYPNTYKVGEKICFPLYHNFDDREPQFKPLEQIRLEKINKVFVD